MVTRTDIISGLGQLGLTRGDTVVVHSSLSSFGEVEGGADAVIDAILHVIGSSGTLVVPTFNYGSGPFDPDATPSQCGIITETVRNRSEAMRSLHPTHSVAAIGRLAEALTESHEKANAFGKRSPLFNVLQANGKILMLGTDFTSNSIIHVAEEIAKLPYLDRSRLIDVRLPSGKMTQKWIRRPGCSVGFNNIEDFLEEDVVTETFIGESRVRIMSARRLVNAAVEALRFDAESMLCDRPDCEVCAEARAMLTATEAEQQDNEIIELAEEEERTRRFIQTQFNGGEVRFFEVDGNGWSPN